MPLAQGMMIMDRLNVYNTATAISVIESGPYTCGEIIHFIVNVINLTSGTPTPTGGTVQIFDLVSNSVIATGTLSDGAVTIPYTLSTSTIKVVAQYLGTDTNPVFDFSVSPNNIQISSTVAATTTTFTVPTDHVRFCGSNDLSFTATVTGSGTPAGNVQFLYSTDTVNYTLFATSTLSGSSASATLPGGTLTGSSGGTEVYFQAVYEGGSCYSPSASVVNDGYVFNNESTITTLTAPANNVSLCADTNLSFTATATAADGVPTGSVEFQYSTDTVTYYTFATSSLSSGSASGTLSAGTLTGSSGGTEVYFQAVYVGNSCYATSTSAVQYGYVYTDVSTTTTIVSPSSGSSFANGAIFDMDVTVSDGSAPVPNEGTVTMYYSPDPFATFPSSWSVFGTGSVVSGATTISGSIATPTSPYFFIAVYTDGGTCYASSMTTSGTYAWEINIT